MTTWTYGATLSDSDVPSSNNHARRTSTTHPDGTRLDYEYGDSGSAGDVLNRLDHLQSGTAMSVDYRYLGPSQPVICGYSCEPSVELTYFTPDGSGDAGDHYTGLDRFGRIIDQRWRKTSDNSDRERVKYGYDRASNRQWRQNTVAGTGQDEYYTYDGLYQVKGLDRGTLNAGKTGITGTPSWEEDWNYDPLGNWNGTSTGYQTKVSGATALNQNRTHNVANEITDITETTGTAWPTPVQNAVGNMTSTPQPFSLGNTFDLKWDAWNRLVEVTSGGSFVARYAYDGANRRISKLTGKEFRHYFYSDQWQIIEERTGNNANADRRFFWGIRSIDDLICRDRGQWERLYGLHDALSVTAVVDVSGFVQERYGYDGFGGVRYMDASFGTRSSSNFDWETLFDGYRYDQETGSYQVRYRYLHPKLGRWLSRDPIGEIGSRVSAPGTVASRIALIPEVQNEPNLYLFVKNNPLNYTDFLGLVCGSWWNDWFFPDAPLGFDFTGPCQNHDDCYGTCGRSKSSCDEGFFNDLKLACDQSGAMSPLACYGFAEAYYLGVRLFGGSAYKDGQALGCATGICVIPRGDDRPVIVPPGTIVIR